METGTSVVPESTVASRSPKNKKLLYGGIAAIVVLGTVVAGMIASSGPSGISPSQIYQVAYASTASSISTQGTVVADSELNLDFQGQGGRVTTINVKVGDKVKAGQVLATLDNSMQQSQVAQAQAGVAVAEGQLAQAQAHVQQLVSGPTSQTVGVVQAAVNSAETALASAQKNYADQQTSFNDRTAAHQQLVQAQNAVATASAALQAAQTNQQSQLNSSQQTLQTAQNNQATYQSNLDQAKTQYGNITEAQVQEAYSTYLNELSAYQSWQNGSYAGTNPYAANLAADQTVYQTLNQGYSALQAAQQAYDGGLTAIQNAKAGLTNVQNAVSTAQAQYDAAQNSLSEAQAAYNDRTQSQQALDNSQNAVAQAQDAVNSAKAQLAQTTQPPKTEDLNAAQAAVQTAQAGVQAAQAQLEQAQVSESYTTLKAPADGTVTQKNIDIGELVSPTQPAFVQDVNQTQVNLPISESQLNFVEQGDKIKLTVPELPGQTFSGHIIEVDPTPIPDNPGDYKAVAVLDGTTDGGAASGASTSSSTSMNAVRPGMTGSVTITLGADPHVLTIPATSLQTVNGIEGVYIIGKATGKTDGSTQGNSQANTNLPQGVYFKPVQVGNMGTQTAQIVNGLKPGDKILLGEGRFLVGPNGSQPTDNGNS